MRTAEEIQIRDPFILTDTEHGVYYLYGTGGDDWNIRPYPHFVVYKTKDLVHFEEPKEIFRAPDGFWATRDFWAPEVHAYRGSYYMFASFFAENHCRGTQILVCDTPDGTFVPLTKEPVTPREWECLDGTLWIENGTPYIVFCHEWLQIHDGTMNVMPLSEDLSHANGDVTVLFRASEPAWANKTGQDFVTDGPFLFRMKDGTLCMLWSSLANGAYVQALSVSESGSVLGPWKHLDMPIFSRDGGHGMLFTTLEGQKMLTLHRPNSAPEHPRFFPVKEENGTLILIP